jgi:hypothetical protein
MPFWFSALGALVGMAMFRTYWEAVVILMISDAMFGANVAKFMNFTFVSSASAFLILVVFHFLKKKIRFYSEY